MGKVFMFILILILCVVIVALPLYLTVNFVCWVFQVPYHLSLIQAFALSLLATVINKLLFKRERDDK